MSVENALDKMITDLIELKKDAAKVDKGNKSAGVRVRKAMQDLITNAKEARKAVLEARAE